MNIISDSAAASTLKYPLVFGALISIFATEDGGRSAFRPVIRKSRREIMKRLFWKWTCVVNERLTSLADEVNYIASPT